MSDRDFLFTLEFSGDGFDAMLGEVATNVLRYAGVTASRISPLADQIRDAVQGAARRTGRYDVRFEAHAGELQIVVSHGAGDEWRITQPIPG